jgi:hypothetical protein
MSDVKRGRGRPKVYFGKVEAYIVSLLALHLNATKVRKILNAPAPKKGRKPSEFYGLRNKRIVPDALGITPPTLGKIAQAHQIVLPKGRPPLAKAA